MTIGRSDLSGGLGKESRGALTAAAARSRHGIRKRDASLMSGGSPRSLGTAPSGVEGGAAADRCFSRQTRRQGGLAAKAL